MSKCHELMNAGLKSHRAKTDYGIREAISKYEEALKHVPVLPSEIQTTL